MLLIIHQILFLVMISMETLSLSFFLFSWKFALNSPVAQLLISLLQERKTINDGVYFLPNFGFWIFLAFNVPIYFQ